MAEKACLGAGTPGCPGTFEDHSSNQNRIWCSDACRLRTRRRAARMGRDVPAVADPVELTDEQLIFDAERRGLIVHKPRPPEAMTFDLAAVAGKERVKLAVVSDTHLGSNFQQLTALREFCAYAIDQGADYFVHVGDVGDGPFVRHRNPQEVFLHSYGAVVDYMVDKLPRGLPWKMISGNHDDWWTLNGGPDSVRTLAERRDDVEYLGKSQGYITFGETTIELMHPNDGGATKTPGLKLRNHLESVSPALKPNLLLMGHYHKFVVAFHRNALGIQLPSFMSQSPWMAGKSLVSEVGGVILEIGLHTKGLASSSKIEIVYTHEPREDDYP